MSEIERDVWDIDDEAEAEAAEFEKEPDENTPLPPLDQLIDSYKPKKLVQLCKNWVWVTGMERFIDRLKPTTHWKAKQFDTQFNYLTEKASVANVLFKTENMLRRYSAPIFSPGRDEIVDGKLYNLWRPSLIVPKKGDTEAWDMHLEWLLPNDEDRNRLLMWMAWVLQNPNRRPGVAILLLGRVTGTGKSFIARVLEQIVGPTNTQRPKNSSLRGDFNTWLALCRLAIIEELNQINKREVTHELRDMITEPTLEVNTKGIPAYKIPNHVCMFGISNEPDALPIQEGDRRWDVIETHITQEEKDWALENGWFDRIMPLVDTDAPGGVDKDFLAAVAWKLIHETDASSFKPGNAKESAAKTTMIKLGEDELVTWLAENRSNDPLTRSFVNIQDDIVEIIPPSVKTWKPNTTIQKWLRDHLNGIPLGRDFRFGDKVQKLWAINNAGIAAKAECDAGVPLDCLLQERAIGREVEAARALRKKMWTRRSAADDFAHDPEPQ